MTSVSQNGCTSASKAGDIKQSFGIGALVKASLSRSQPTCLDCCEHRLLSSQMTHFAYTASNDGLYLGPLL